jgi:acyl-[acyl-carrier-protein] desaturase
MWAAKMTMPQLFDQFAGVTQRIGVYTARDYSDIIGHLNEAWGVGHRSVAGKAAKAQDYLCRQPERYEHLAGEIADRVAERPPARFSWVHGRPGMSVLMAKMSRASTDIKKKPPGG